MHPNSPALPPFDLSHMFLSSEFASEPLRAVTLILPATRRMPLRHHTRNHLATHISNPTSQTTMNSDNIGEEYESVDPTTLGDDSNTATINNHPGDPPESGVLPGND